MTVITTSTGNGQPYWQTCACCGRRIRLIVNQQHLSFFLEEKSLQRRAFQCASCNNVICQECRESGDSCTCKNNTWLARPYLDLSVVRLI